ncbi:MAG: cysteine peptidase family C39 domain-containing protein [Corynebacterium sp.]|nr:cysteine peptidase family C39 domain-containing protein [Corynebacterium sp.]
MKLIMQNSEQDCLLACLAMIMSEQGVNLSPTRLLNEVTPQADGLSLSDIQALGQNYGFRVRGFADHENTFLAAPRTFSEPLIAFWQNQHFVVVGKMSGRSVSVYDPALGKLKLGHEEFRNGFSGVWIQIENTGTYQSPKKIQLPDGLRAFSRRHTGLLIFSLLIGQGASLLLAWYLQNLQVLSEAPTILLAAVFFLLFLHVLTLFSSSKAQAGLARSFEKNFSHRLFSSLLHKNLPFFRGFTVGGLLELINIRSGLRDIYLSSALPALIGSATALVLSIYIFFVSPLLALSLLGISVIYILVSSYTIRKEQLATASYMHYYVDFSGIAQSDLSNISETKVLREEQKIEQRWKEESAQLCTSFIGTLHAQNISTLVRNIYYMAIVLATAIFAFKNFTADKASIADVVFFQAIGAMLANSINSFQGLLTAISKARVYETRLEGLSEENRQQPEDRHDDSLAPQVLIQAQNLEFGYPGLPPVFSLEELKIRQGEKIAVVGASGSGKTTLLYTVLNTYAHQGELLYSPRFQRSDIGVVLPEMTLRQGSIFENLTVDEHTTEAEIWQALHAVDMDTVIAALPKGLNSTVLERGTNFSSGQAQRLLIARSLLRGKTLMCWDEALNRLDDRTRNTLYRRIFGSSVYSDRTIVAVSHNLDILTWADRMIFLESGSPTIAIGTHKELLNLPNYRNFIDPEEKEL